MKQSELIKQLSDEDLKKNLIFTQFIFIIVSALLSLFLFDDFYEWLLYFKWDAAEILYYGCFSGLAITAISFILMKVFPAEAFDDGGINIRIFSGKKIRFILFISLLIAISEELLFRGVIQTTFGFIFASIFFAVIHVRYLKKPVLFISVLFVSFYIGFLFELTENLFVTITVHFIVDFLLGLYICFRGEVQQH